MATDWIRWGFGEKRGEAEAAYRRFVVEGRNQPSPWERRNNQVYLGSEAFVKAMQQKVQGNRLLSEVPRAQRRPVARPLSGYFDKHEDRDAAVFEAYRSGGYNMREIGDVVGLHYSRISRIIGSVEKARSKT